MHPTAMTNHIYWMTGSHTTAYIKLLYTPQDLGIGISLDFDGGLQDGWEFTLHLVCFQVWIGA